MNKPRSYLMLIIAACVVVFGATTRVDASSWREFGSCLNRAGATFYGASWCPYCEQQRETLGDAMSGVRYVECSINGERQGSTRACEVADVNSYPTWVFADGTRANGAQSVERLARKTGCEIPEGSNKAKVHRGF